MILVPFLVERITLPMKYLISFFLVLTFWSCREKKTPWLEGDEKAKFDALAAQLPGFGDFMREYSGRFHDLYYAGRKQNWELASYQLSKMKSGLEKAVMQRDEFQQSVEIFNEAAFLKVEEGIAKRDSVIFTTGIRVLAVSCNACHVQNNVEFIRVKMPQ